MTDNLIARLEAAEGPSRELDVEIHETLGNEVILGAGKHPMNRTGGGRVPKYSESLDAAVSLVPEGWEGQVNVNGEGGCWIDPPSTGSMKVYGIGRIYAHAATNPLALCIAALKAREA